MRVAWLNSVRLCNYHCNSELLSLLNSAMKRDIEWKDKTEDGVKRMVRIKFPGQRVIKWQFKRADEERWDYDTPPSDEDWQFLVQKVEAMYNRNRCAHRDVELVKKSMWDARNSGRHNG